jgi:SAM-dependent methyltransferase
VKTQVLPPEIDRDVDANVIATVQRLLDSRRRAIGKAAPRAQHAAEIAFCQKLDAAVQHHLNQLAARAYGGKHPKHWLWKSHKQFIMDRVEAGQRVLDVGCGCSAYLLWMAEKGCEVTGCDSNRRRIEEARAAMSHPNLVFEVRDVVSEPPAMPFDVVVCSHVIEHIDDPVPLLRALKSNGKRLIVAVPPHDSRWQKVMYRDLGLPWKDDEDHRREYTPDLLRQQLDDAGWRVTELHAGIDIKAVAVHGGIQSSRAAERSST